MPYSPRLLISFSHSKIVLFFECFTNCLYNIGCKDQVRVNCIIIIFLYIFNNFSFVNYHYEENKLRKKVPCFGVFVKYPEASNNPKLWNRVYIDKTECKNRDRRTKKPEAWRFFREAFEASQYWQSTQCLKKHPCYDILFWKPVCLWSAQSRGETSWDREKPDLPQNRVSDSASLSTYSSTWSPACYRAASGHNK